MTAIVKVSPFGFAPRVDLGFFNITACDLSGKAYRDIGTEHELTGSKHVALPRPSLVTNRPHQLARMAAVARTAWPRYRTP
jgi:hypothetical protein